CAPSNWRGTPPVAISTTPALISRPSATTLCGPASLPRAAITSTPSAASRAATSADCARASAFTRAVSRAASTVTGPAGPPGPGANRAVVASDPDPESGGPGQVAHGLGGGDEGLGRHAVGQHAAPAEPVGLHHRHPGPELRRDQRSLVTAGAAPEYRDIRARLAHDAPFCRTQPPGPPRRRPSRHPRAAGSRCPILSQPGACGGPRGALAP